MRPLPKHLDDYVARYIDTYRVLRLGHFPEEQERDRALLARLGLEDEDFRYLCRAVDSLR